MSSVMLPDGTSIEFPDTMSQGQISAAVQQHIVGNPDAGKTITAGERFAKGAKDPVDAGAQALVHALSPGFVDKVETATYPFMKGLNEFLGMKPPTLGGAPALDKDIQGSEAEYQRRREGAGNTGFDWWRLGGNVAATAPLAYAAPAGATLGGAAAVGAGTGAATGALTPVLEPTDDFWKEKAKQAGVGAATGGVLGTGLRTLSNVVQPTVDKGVKLLMDKGVTPTAGQILGGGWARTEEKLTSFPLLGDLIKNRQRDAMDGLNRAVYRDVLDPLGVKVPDTVAVGRDGVKFVKDELTKAYDTLLPKVRFTVDTATPAGQKFVGEVNNLSTLAQNLPEAQAKQYFNILKTQVVDKLGPQMNVDGKTFKGIESELGLKVKNLMADPSADQKELGTAVKQLLETMRTHLADSNPAQAAELGAINRGYSLFTRLRDAAGRVGTDEGAFTPAQLLSAVRNQDRSVGHGAFATGQAPMQELADAGKSVLGSKYPDSGTPGRTLLNLMFSGAIPGAATMSPEVAAAMAAPLAAAPAYTPWGARAMATALAKRPTAYTAPLAEALDYAAPALSSGGIFARTFARQQQPQQSQR